MTAVFDVTDFLHPLDMSARQQLERIPLLQATVKKYLSVVTDRKVRQALLASALRLGPKQLPEIYRLLPPICEAFGIAEPELYLTRGGEANAMTVGHTRTAIVIYNQLLEDLAEDEIQAVLAHECGHILAEHILYRQMANAMLRAGATAGGLGTPVFKAVAGLATGQIQAALIDWYRKSELTADRAAVAYFRDPEPMQRALFHILGVPKWWPGEVSYSAFLEQAAEFDQVTEASRWDRYLARTLESGSTHPIPAVRIRELTVWAESPAFKQLAGIAKTGGMAERVGCGKCGQELDPGWHFCLRCGEPVQQAAADYTGEQA
ncbi:MAG TPA: M48 family metallopeptidase [Streptosporangiaceae bacterium]|nr:M48 family metallopeptidase [Streptosporangiaceae bacterium]